MTTEKLTSVHPGEIILEDFIKQLGVSQYRLCKDISVQPRRINQIVRGERSITAETALRLSRYFGTSDRSWLNLQSRYDIETEKDRLGIDWFLRLMNSLPPRQRSSRQRWILHSAGLFGASPLAP